MTLRNDSNRREDDRGIVFDIQRFSVHDGPGIRTTVFMKGCPLRCLWCSNPESQDPHPNLMVRDINCRRCGACAEVCPESAIAVSNDQGRTIDWETCSQCLDCAEACVCEALAVCGKYMDVEEIVSELVRDDDFYRNSGGGITVSGGEPLTQAEFVGRLLEECKDRGLHTALDTSGYAPWDTMEKVLRFTDLILFDVKHLDSDEHRRATGVDNAIILENLSRVSAFAGTGLWLRMPLVAGFNDAEEHIENVAKLGEELGVEKISLLPYHEGGLSKCRQLGRTYGYREGRAPTKKHLERLKEMLEKRSLKVSVNH